MIQLTAIASTHKMEMRNKHTEQFKLTVITFVEYRFMLVTKAKWECVNCMRHALLYTLGMD